MAGRNVTARFSVEADVAQAKRDLEGITQQVDQLGKTKVDNVRQELEQLTASTGKLATGYTALTQEQRQAYQQREQDAQSVERLRRSYKTLEGALEAVDVQVQHGHRSAEDAVRIQGLLAQAYGRTNAVIGQGGQAFQGGVNATRAAIVAQESAAASTKRLNGVMQQAGWQVSDFANQMANGGNVATAAGMQLGQLLGSLGPMGAAIGAIVNVGGVLAGVLTKTGDEAELTATSFTSYTKALEFAKRASEEMKGASEGVRAALEAEGRAAVDAAQKRLTKAESELKALEAGIMSTPDAASAAGAALTYLWDAGKVKELRQEIEVLRGTLGQYNDGAREVRVSTEQGSGALKNARNAIEEYRESLRQQIDQTKLLADNEDLSNAGKLRARLETEALARAQAAGRTEIDAGTKALIKDLVAQQERIDTLEEEEKASKKATTAAETLEKARKKVVDDLDRDIAAQKRLAEVAGMSAAQQAEANVQTRIAAELAKAHTTASTEEGKAIAAKVKEAERWKRVAGDEKLLKSAEDQLAYARQELALIGQSANVRDRALKSIQIQRDAVKEWGDTTSEAAQKWISLQEQIADTQALTQYATEVKATSKEIASSISENLYDRLTDPNKATSAVDFFKSIFKRIAVAAIESAVVLPIVTQIVGSMPSLFGVQAPAGAGGIAGAAQESGGLLSNATNLVSLGRSGWSLLSGGSGLAATQAAGSFATSSLGEALGLSTSAAGVIPEAAATDMMLTGSGNAVVGAAGTIGAAMPYGVVGGVLGGLAGTAMNSKAGGALVGAAAGAGAAGIGAGIWGMSAVGGPWGIAAAAIISAVMGMLGTQKKTVGPNSAGNLVLDGAGGFRTDQALADNGADASQMQQVTDSIAKAMNAVIAGIGGKLTGGDGANTGLIQYFAKDNKWLVTPQVGDKAGEKTEFTDQTQAIQFYMRESLKGLIGNGSLTGVNEDVKTVLAKSNAATSEALTKHLQLAATFQDSVYAMNNAIGLEDAARKQGKTAAADLTMAIKDFRQTAADAGLDATKAAAATRNWIDTLVSGADPRTYTAYEAQAAQYRAQWSNMGDVLQAVGYSAADAAQKMDEGLNNSLKKLAKTLNTSLDQQINSALGRDYLNQITRALEDEQINVRDLAAVGEPITKAQTLRAAQLDSIMRQLDATQLDVITSTYGVNSDIGRLAQSIKAMGASSTETAATIAAANAALASFQADLQGRMYAAVGNDRSAQLIALDAQQAKALADARAAGYDTKQLQQVQAAERAAKAFQLAQADLLGAYDAQIAAQQDYISGLTNGAVKIAQSARQFRSAFDALALNDNSPLSDLERLNEARRQAQVDYATYKDTTKSDDERDAAKQDLLSMGPNLIQLARSYFGPTNSTDYDWMRSVFAEFGDTTALGVDTAESTLKTANDTLKELQRGRAEAAAAGQKQYGALTGLRDVMDQSLAVWKSVQTPLLALTGTRDNTPRYAASPTVQAAWNGLSGAQQMGVARAMGWGGSIDQAFNIWLATSSSRASSFGENVLSIAGGTRYGASADVQTAWDALTQAQQLGAVRSAGYDGGIDAGLNAWVTLGHQAAFEAAVREQAHLAGIPGFATGTPSAPPGLAWVGEQGPELVRLAGGERIFPHDASIEMAQRFNVANDRLPAGVSSLRPRLASSDAGVGAMVSELRKFREEARQDARAIADTVIDMMEKQITALREENAELRRRIDKQSQEFRLGQAVPQYATKGR